MRLSDRPLRIGMVAPVAREVPPQGSGSIEAVTSLLTEGLVARGHQVTLFATGGSTTASMSELLIAFHPRIEEPSKGMPSGTDR